MIEEYRFKIHRKTLENYNDPREVYTMFAMIYALLNGTENYGDHVILKSRYIGPKDDVPFYHSIELNDKRRLEVRLWKAATKQPWWKIWN